MKPKHLLVIAISLITGYLSAQTSVQIKDIYVQPFFQTDTVSSQSDYLEMYEILFKAKNIEEASFVHVQFGTMQDTDDVLSIQAEVIYQGNSYFVIYDGEQEEIIGYDTRIFVGLSSEQKELYQYITLYIEDNQGNISNKLYFNK